MNKERIYALQMNVEITDQVYDSLLSKISPEKRIRVLSFFKREDALRCLFADLLTRYLIFSELSLKNEQISFGYSEFGKPFLIADNNFHFNISHSGEWIVCAISGNEIGIDIEKIKPVDLQIAENYFSKNEIVQLFSMPVSARNDFFYQLWALKESYIKMKGLGLSIPLDSFSMAIGKDKVTLISENETDPVFCKQYAISPHYKMAVSTMVDDFKAVTFLPMQDVINQFT